MLLLIFSVGSCNDPIFYTISMEVAPIEPYIKGGAVNYTVYQDRLYTAAGTTLYSYTGSIPTVRNRWNIGFYAQLTVELENTAGTQVTIAKGNYSYTTGTEEDAIIFNCLLRGDLSVGIGEKTELIFFANKPGELDNDLPAEGSLDAAKIILKQTPPLADIPLESDKFSGSITKSADGKARIPSPGGKIMNLASISKEPVNPSDSPQEFLYALCLKNQNRIGSAVVKRYNETSGIWDEVGDRQGYTLRSLFAAKDKVFIGAEKRVGAETGNTSAIFCIDGDSNTMDLLPDTERTQAVALNGAAYDGVYYYLCTNSDIIFRWDGNTVVRLRASNVEFAGIINLNDTTVVAINRNGALFSMEESLDEEEENTENGTGEGEPGDTGSIPIKSVRNADNKSISFNGYANGTLAVWTDKDNNDKKLLLAGVQDSMTYNINSGYTYGYRELPLYFDHANGITDASSFRDPGKPSGTFVCDVSSVEDYERYLSTLGKHPVAYIFQAPPNIDANMTLFASTQKSGVWSYRSRNNEPQWNAETRN